MPSFPYELQEAYEQHYRNYSQPKFDDLKKIFLAIIQEFGCVFFVVDALDECTLHERKDLIEFLLSITGIVSTSASYGTVKLFVTSRKAPDIEQAFQQNPVPTIEIEATKVNSDIELYVKAQIELRVQNGRLNIQNMSLKDEILSALTMKAGGMYVPF